MNTELLREIATAIENQSVGRQKVGLNMLHWHGRSHPCGTSACVAGYAQLLRPDHNYVGYGNTGNLSAKLLGLTQPESEELFHGFRLVREIGVAPISAQKRINASEHLVPDALRWMADNETIDWRQGLDHACSIREKIDERP